MTRPISITQDKNANVIHIGSDVAVLFSYAATVAFRDGAKRYVNPVYVGFSKATAGHLNAHGFGANRAGVIVADTEVQFNAILADALRRGAVQAQDNAIEAVKVARPQG